MSKIAYDPVKNRFADIIRGSRRLRTVFYRLLDLFFLRSWYVRRLIRRNAVSADNQPWRLLDAGCGFGQYDRFLLRTFQNIEVDAVDVKTEYLRDCERYFRRETEQGRIRFRQADLLSFDEENRYDAAICIDVLEHIEDDRLVMKNLYRSLKKGGFFLMHSPSHYAEADAGEETTFVDEHARTGYSKEEITEKLKTAGFSEVDTGYTYGRWGHSAWVLLIKYPMLLMNKMGLAALILLFPYYLLTLLPGLAMMRLDMQSANHKGTGIYAIGRKIS